MARFKITENECEAVEVTNEVKSVDHVDKQWCLIGELMTSRRFNREAFRKTMLNARQCKGVKFMEIEENVFLFSFFDVAPMLYV